MLFDLYVVFIFILYYSLLVNTITILSIFNYLHKFDGRVLYPHSGSKGVYDALDKKGKPLFFEIFAGYYVVQIICAIFVYGVNSLLPNVMEVMKYIGAAYILWLAIHIAFSKKTSENTEQSASFLKGFMLFFELVIATIGTIATCTWIGLGVLIQKFYLRHFRVINIILALTLLECIWEMLR